MRLIQRQCWVLINKKLPFTCTSFHQAEKTMLVDPDLINKPVNEVMKFIFTLPISTVTEAIVLALRNMPVACFRQKKKSQAFA